MRRFYETVRTDRQLMRFYAACSRCGERRYAERLPLICRNPRLFETMEKGRGGVIRQRAYNHAKAVSVQHLARFFNQCSHCGNWVCDSCYNTETEEGLCCNCSQCYQKMNQTTMAGNLPTVVKNNPSGQGRDD